VSYFDRLIEQVEDIAKSLPDLDAKIPAIAVKAIRENERVLSHLQKNLLDAVRYKDDVFVDSEDAWRWILGPLRKALYEYWIQAWWQYRSAHPEVPVKAWFKLDSILKSQQREAARLIAKAVTALLKEELIAEYEARVAERVAGRESPPELVRPESASGSVEDAEPVAISRRRLELRGEEFRIDDTWHPLPGQKRMDLLKILLEAPVGEYVSVKAIQAAIDSRVRRILQEMPPEVRAIIQGPQPGVGGYRIDPEYWK
jgi:hypothetical protein